MNQKLFLALLLFLSSQLILSQKLSLNDLVWIEKQNSTEIDDFLTKKGWTFDGARDESAVFVISEWIYWIDTNKVLNNCRLYLIKEKYGEGKNLIKYNFLEPLYYDEIKKQAEKYDFNLIEKTFEGDETKDIKEGSSHTLVIQQKTFISSKLSKEKRAYVSDTLKYYGALFMNNTSFAGNGEMIQNW